MKLMDSTQAATRLVKVLVISAISACFMHQALAIPATYQATVVTDVKVGHKMFHAATLTLTFEGNTTDVDVVKDASGMPLSSEQCGPNGLAGFNGNGPGPNGPFFYALSKGRASLRVESKGKAISAQFAPGQVFIAFDLCNGGIGFGSHVGPNHLEPAYPLGFQAGTAMYFTLNAANPLTEPGNMTGLAWSCIGYPHSQDAQNSCTSPNSYPLHSDAGDVFVYQPYAVLPMYTHTGTANRGTFSIVVGATQED
jgi:hypothetical protein